MAFIGAIMEVQGKEVPYYRGMFSNTFLNGYVFDLRPYSARTTIARAPGF